MSCSVYIATSPRRLDKLPQVYFIAWLCESCKAVHEFKGWTFEHQCACPRETCDVCDPHGVEEPRVLH